MFVDMYYGNTIVFWTRYYGNIMFLDMYYGNIVVLLGLYHAFGQVPWQYYSILGAIPCLWTCTMAIL